MRLSSWEVCGCSNKCFRTRNRVLSVSASLDPELELGV